MAAYASRRPAIRVVEPLLRVTRRGFPRRLIDAVSAPGGAVVYWPGIERQSQGMSEALDAAVARGVQHGGKIDIYGYRVRHEMRFPEPSGTALGKLLGSVEIVLPAVAQSVRRARRLAHTIAASLHASEAERFDYIVAIGEALSNALAHGSPRGPRDMIGVRVALYAGGLVAQIWDHGSWSLPGPDEEAIASTGRGLGIMRQLADEIRVEPMGDGTLVSLTKRHTLPLN